ncbi:hypothetical protein AVEN_266503-1 [Araneus ventricosus]|uniref:Uncharacterized protein n=1 Tax=Araneus ventricosus TaxID=182803 RepID=A0A4Y2I2X1_ARAVE|nr:hypothetical protein AVEN_266503-1 [Araneus ventricosus]
MPDPNPSEGDSSSKEKDVSISGAKSQKIPTESLSKATPTFSKVISRPVAPVRAAVPSQRDSHVVLLRPKEDSTSEENRKRVETALTVRNSPARISCISKVSRGGLIIEVPSPEDLQALEVEIACFHALRSRSQNAVGHK